MSFEIFIQTRKTNLRMDISLHIDSIDETYEEVIILGDCFWKESKEESVVQSIAKTDSIGEIQNLLEKITGFFTIIKELDSGYVIATDYINSYPLYYSIENGYYITDSSEKASALSNQIEFDPVSLMDYRQTSFVTGHYSLLENVHQTQSGEICHIEPEKIRRYRYFNFEYGSQTERTVDDVNKNWEKVISRTIEYAAGRPIWIPLSGGFDSRYIITELARKGYEDLHAFSWASRPTHTEYKTAKRVAESLSVDFHHLDQSHEEWYSTYRTEDRLSVDKKFWLSSVPVLREWKAVRQLRSRGELSENSVVIPGHSGDMIAGSHLSDISEMGNTQSDIVAAIIQKHHRYGQPDLNQSVIRAVAF